MNLSKLFIALCFVLMQTLGWAQTADEYPEYRGIYISHTGQLIHDIPMQDSVLLWLNREQITAAAIYELALIIGTQEEDEALYRFIRRLRNETSIKWVGAVGRTFEFFNDKVHPFQTKYGKDGWFDFYMFEYLWWNSNTFTPFSRQFDKMARNFGAIPAYLYFDKIDAEEKQRQKEYSYVVNNTNRVFVPFYGSKPDYHSVKDHLLTIAIAAQKAGKNTDVVALFNMEDDQSGPYSSGVSYNKMYQDILVEFEKDKAHYPEEYKHINLTGYHIFTHIEAMKNRP